MKRIFAYLAVTLTLVLGGLVGIAQVNPGLVSFFKGTPIVADEVNQNFTYLSDKIVGADSALASQAEQLTELADRVEVVEATGGPVGPQGPAGADGADGAMGPQGPAGSDGVDGADGATGPAGADGSDGFMGPQGPAGADGATGPQGPQGPEGPAGPAGSDGVGIEAHFGGGGSASGGFNLSCTVGDVWLTAGNTGGGIPANGQMVSTLAYARLYAVIGNDYGGDSATFALPDLRDVAPKSGNGGGRSLTYVICADGVDP